MTLSTPTPFSEERWGQFPMGMVSYKQVHLIDVGPFFEDWTGPDQLFLGRAYSTAHSFIVRRWGVAFTDELRCR